MRKIVTTFTSVIALLVATAATSLAQYSGGPMNPGTPGSPTYTAPKSGYGSHTGMAVGIGLGAAAAGGITYWVLHNRPNVVGCVQQTGHQTTLTNEKDGKTYSLMPDSDVVLKPGERVGLKGKKVADSSGHNMFEASKLVKDYGACVANVASSAKPGNTETTASARPAAR